MTHNPIYMRVSTLTAALALWGATLTAQEAATDLTPKIGGTLRSKYEYQTAEGKGRFTVRTARVNIRGSLSAMVAYKAEIDLCDEGQIKMLDAYTTLTPVPSLGLTIGQMRVPFTIDAHRSPHSQYFANRSFIAKQVGNIRDVGAKLEWAAHPGFPVRIEAGAYNGSGLTDQKDFWTSSVNFAAKAQLLLPVGLNVVMSAQKIKPDAVPVMMYNVGLTYHRSQFLAEAEYLYKHYGHGAFAPVHAVNVMGCYDIALRHRLFTRVSLLARYDYMSDHSDGRRYADGEPNSLGSLIVNDYRRSRVTAGVTLSMNKPFVSDLRINYEKYMYRSGAIVKPSEGDKIVVEVMTHF